MTTAKPKGVRTTHPEYDAMVDRWRRCRDAASGQDAVHAGGTLYLPALAEEKAVDYAARVKRTSFFNATWRTISGMRGMLFRKDPTLEAPESIAALTSDINMAGTPLDTFAQRVVAEALTVGRVGLLADHPPAAESGARTVAEAQRAGLRPSLQLYTAESVINWKTARIGNATVLSMVVLREDVSVPGDEFSHASEPRYRVLDLDAVGVYRQRVFRVNDKGDDEQVGGDIYPTMRGAPLREIPFTFIACETLEPTAEAPPLIDLVDLNLAHYMVTADYEHGCHFSGLPTLFVSGYAPPGDGTGVIYIGGPTANCLPDPQARAEIVQVNGDFAALRANLDDKQAQMAILGARMLEAQKIAAEAAETVGQHRKGEESLLAATGKTIGMGLTRALTWFARWAGVDAEVSYRLCTDFMPEGLSAQELTAMVGAWQAGMPGYSDQGVFAMLQRRGAVAPDATFDEEQARIEDRGPRIVAPTPGV